MTSTTPFDPYDARPAVLVIDDELGPRESLRFLLKEEYRVLCADSVDRGLDLVREHMPDVVIMDIRMPGRNGIDGLREIRKINADLSVIMLTGFAALGTAQEAIRFEANDYMEKPFDASEMRAVVQRHVEQARLRRKRSRLLSDALSLNRRICDLQEKELLTELGQSSAEFIHDLRNLVTMVTSASSLLREEIDDLKKRQSEISPDADDYLDMLDNAMHRCVDLLDTWQRLIKKAPQHQTLFRFHEFVQNCEKDCRPATDAAHAQVTLECSGDEAELFGDRVQLERVLVNLIQNAIHALPPVDKRIRIRSEVHPSWLRVSVADNGCGIPEENLQTIFSPDFTTRRSIGGMGLGLFISQKIAQNHGGKITVESVVNQGSTFTLHLQRQPVNASSPG